jgi:hypothetical protein
MKQLLIIPFLFLAACASRPPKSIVINHIEPSRANVAPLRLSENVREYRFGRYLDPRDPRVMHESHHVYRIETDARWDLNQSASSAPSPTNPGATKSVVSNDAVVSEVNKQRAATKAFIEQTSTLNQKLGELSKAAGQSEEIAKQNLALKSEVTVLQQRLDAFETQLRDRKQDVPTPLKPATEDKW